MLATTARPLKREPIYEMFVHHVRLDAASFVRPSFAFAVFVRLASFNN